MKAGLVGAIVGAVLVTGLPLAPGALAEDSSSTGPLADSAAAAPDSQEMTDRLIVGTTSARVADTTLAEITATAATNVGVDVAVEVLGDITPRQIVVSLGESLSIADVQALADAVESSTAVAYAEPDRIVRPAVTLPNDQYVADEWGLWDSSATDGGYSTRAPDAWPTARGLGVVVAIIDTGITAHPDLDPNVVAGYDFVSDTRISNDGDGWDADASDPGDWITSDESASAFFSGCPASPSSWHGTHVAGTVAAVADNTIGVAGVAPLARIQPVRALGKCFGYISDIATAIRWSSGLPVADVPVNATPAKVINMSLGGSGTCSVTEQSAINAARLQGSVIVAAAGNEGTSASTSSPGNCDGVITVAAHDRSGARAPFSNFGSVVEISGPGVGIKSTLNAGTQGPVAPTYATYSGTSMATPHVAAAAALLFSAAPTLTPDQVLSTLQASSQPFAGGSQCNSKCGSGYVDARGALASLVPGAPGPVTLTAGYESLNVAWTAPSGSAPPQYDVAYSDDSVTWSTAGSTAATSTTITGLSDDSTYWVRVRATSVGGSSAWTVSSGAVPLTPTVPGAPGPITATPGDSTLGLTWSAPADNGGRAITSYTVEYSTDEAAWTALVPVAGTSATLATLTNGQAYFLRVAATNSIGTGPWTRATGTPVAPPPINGGNGGATDSGGGGGGGGGAAPPPAAPAVKPPGAPVITEARAGDRSVALAWAASDDTGGAAVESYVVEVRGSETTRSESSESSGLVVTGLTNGAAYQLRVASVNSAGTGEFSAWTDDLTPGGPAGPPVNVRAIAGDRSVALSWAPPTETGGRPVNGYVIDVASASSTREYTVSDTSTTLLGLRNGTSYAIRIAAQTAAGPGAWSTPVDVTPSVPRLGKPTDVRMSRKGRMVRVRWLAPATGSPTGYVVSAAIDGKPFRVIATSNRAAARFSLPDAGATVQVRVAALASGARGPWSDPVLLRRR